MKAMILAAGQGKRLRPLTLTCPKPLIKIGSKSLLEYHIQKLKQAGITNIIINSAYLSDQIVAFVNHYNDSTVSLYNSVEEGNGLETAGGIIKALPFFDDNPFLVINGDIFIDAPYNIFTNYPFDANKFAHLFMISNPAHNLKGDFAIDNDGNLQLGSAYTFSGVGLYTKKAFANLDIKRYPLRPIFEDLIKQGKVSANFVNVQWFDVGTIDRLHELEHYLKIKNEVKNEFN